MSLAKSLEAFTQTAPATKNRVDILLETLTGEDLGTLTGALHNKLVRGADLTKALRKEYGHDVVRDSSVGEWRRKNLSELTGL